MRRGAEHITLTRSVRVARIPDGYPMELLEGEAVIITQALGSSFTLWADGQLVRLSGDDADAIGEEVPEHPELPDSAAPEEVEALAWEAMRTCYDPEIPVDIYELGLIYKVDVNDDRDVLIDMTLTAPGCGMGEVIANEVNDKVLNLPRVEECTVNIVFDPPWDRSMMTEEAKLALGM